MKAGLVSPISSRIAAQQRPLLPCAADAPPGNRADRDIRLSDLGNASLPGTAPPDSASPPPGLCAAKKIGALLTVTAVGCCVTYWTFGWPIFGPLEKPGEGVPVRSAHTRDSIHAWARVDRVLRKSVG